MVTAWQQCPLMWKYKYVDKRKDKPNVHLARGTVAHYALEHLFDDTVPPQERGKEALHRLFRKHWSELRVQDDYAAIFNGDRDKERKWGLESLEVLNAYYELENPADVAFEAREAWFDAPLAALLSNGQGSRRSGVSAGNVDNAPNLALARLALLPAALAVKVVGKVDRIDRDPRTGNVVVVDYKTGSAPFGTGPGWPGRSVEEEAEILDDAVTQSRLPRRATQL
jgi:hypothetical protein